MAINFLPRQLNRPVADEEPKDEGFLEFLKNKFAQFGASDIVTAPQPAPPELTRRTGGFEPGVMNNILGSRQIDSPTGLQQQLGFTPAPEPVNQQERTQRIKTFRDYRKRGGKLAFNQWELMGMPADITTKLPSIESRKPLYEQESEDVGYATEVFGRGLLKLPRQTAAAVLQATQGKGGASVVDRDWADRFITDAQTDLNLFVEEVTLKQGETLSPIKASDIAQLPQNMAFSLTSMGAGLGVGVPTALAPVPGARVAAWVAGSAASGAVAYQMTTYQIMQQYLEIKDAQMRASTGRGITPAEEKKLKADFDKLAHQYGLWEAVPEAVSNLLFAKLLTTPLTKMAGKNIASQILQKVVGMYGQEFITETITQKMQAGIEAKVGMREEGVTWGEAFREIAPQTFLLTTVLAGAGQTGVSAYNKIKKSLDKEIPKNHPRYDEILEQATKWVDGTSEQASMIPPSVQAVQGVVGELTPDQKQAEAAGLREWMASEPAYDLTNLIKKSGWYKGEVSNLTIKQYKDLTGKTSIKPNILTKDGKHVRWEYALDELATEMGYEDGEALKYAIEQTGEALTKAKGLEREVVISKIPYTEIGQPEAGLQPGMFGGQKVVRPKGKGQTTQIKMDDAVKLAELQKGVQPTPEVTPTEAPVGGLPREFTRRTTTKRDRILVESSDDLERGQFKLTVTDDISGDIKAVEYFDDLEGTIADNFGKAGVVTEVTTPTQPTLTAPQTAIEAPEAISGTIPPTLPPAPPETGITSEVAAVTEVAGVPPKPPKDWDKVGGQLYDRFKQQSSNPTPNTVPISGRLKRGEKIAEKVVSDEFARLNSLGWQAELDVAMLRASGTQSAEVYKQTMKSVVKSLGNDSDLLSYVDDYLMLRRQLEVLKATGRKYFTIKKGAVTQRFTANQIGLLFAQMKKELGIETYAKVKEAATHVPAVYNKILRDTQELTPEQIEGLIKKYPWFTPTLFKDDTVPVDITGKLSPRQIRELTTLESDKDNITPLMSLPTTIAKRMKAQATNDARKSIAELAVDPKNTQLIGGDVEIVAKKPDGAFIDYFDNGERKYLKLGKGSEWIAKDIDLFQRQPPGMMMTMVRSLQNLSKMFFTTYNPGFVAWNTFFDGMVAYFSEGIGPWGFGKALAGNIKGMFTDVPGLNEFRRSGGELFGFFERGSREGLEFGEGEKTISPYVSTKGGRLVLKNPESLKRFLNPFTFIRELGLAGENAGRRATYEKAIKEGLSPKEAALRGRRVSVDFSRFSQASRFINDWFIYFNPAMQGLLMPGRAIAKNPRTLWRLAALVAGYVALTFYNQSFDEYDDVRNSDKVGKLLVMLPSDEYNNYGQKVPHYLTLLPFREFAIVTAPIEYLMGRLRTEEPEAYRTLGQEFGVFYPIVTPLSMISESGGLVMPTQIGATIQQIIQNHDDFRDRPIIDDEMGLLPAAQQYDQYTNSLAIRVGQALNMSPKKLDFFVSNMFGALGSDSLRSIDMAIQTIDKEDVDDRIAGLVNDLRTIPTNVPPNKIEVARETFLEGLSTEDRQLVLNMERLPDDKIPFMASLFRRFFKDYGGQVYATAKEKALAARTIDDYPPEALEKLQDAALENANNLLASKITKYQYDQNRTRYRAYYSGAGTAEWRQGMIEGAVARSDVDKFMPESYKRAKEFQAVSSYMEIREKYISKAGGVLDSKTWDKVEQDTLSEMRNHYSEGEIQYAIAHKDDWIDKLPEPARTLERRRAREIDDNTWWNNYRGSTSSYSSYTPPVPAGITKKSSTPSQFDIYMGRTTPNQGQSSYQKPQSNLEKYLNSKK